MSPKNWFSISIAVLLFFWIASAPLFAVAIAISRSRHMTFADAAPGDIAYSLNHSASTSSRFTVTGDPGASFDITFPSGTINMSNGGNTIGTNTWVSNQSATTNLDGSGNATIDIGATRAAIAGNQVAGSYSGSHTVTVNYTGDPPGNAVSTSANHSILIISSIGISRSSDLTFGVASASDIAKTIDPASGSGRATYTITGEPSHAFSITIPSSTVTMTTSGGGSADNEIDVTAFASSPSSSSTLDGSGNRTLYVGATRAAIRATQTIGSYTGSFTVTVAYQ